MIRRILEAIDEVELRPTPEFEKPAGFYRISGILHDKGWNLHGGPEVDDESPGDPVVYTYTHPGIGGEVNVKVGAVEMPGEDEVEVDSVFVNAPGESYEIHRGAAAVARVLDELMRRYGGKG